MRTESSATPVHAHCVPYHALDMAMGQRPSRSVHRANGGGDLTLGFRDIFTTEQLISWLQERLDERNVEKLTLQECEALKGV